MCFLLVVFKPCDGILRNFSVLSLEHCEIDRKSLVLITENVSIAIVSYNMQK